MGAGSSSKSKRLSLDPKDDGGAAALTLADRPVSPNHLLRPLADAPMKSPRKCSKNSAMAPRDAGGSKNSAMAPRDSAGSRNASKVSVAATSTRSSGSEDSSMVRKPSLKSPHGTHPPGPGLHVTASSPQKRVPSKLSPYVTSDHTGPSGDRHATSPRGDRHGHQDQHDHGHGHHRQAESGDAERPPARIVVMDKDMEEIENLFPTDEYEMTLYAVLPRFAPGDGITMQDFKEKKELNGVKGKCMDHDGRLHVWTVLVEDGRKMRVVPKVLQKALQKPDIAPLGKPVEGYVAYGNDCISVILDEPHVTSGVHRHVKEHITRPKTPPKEEQVVDQPRVKFKKKAKKKSVDTEAPQEEEKDVVKPFEVGDSVVMKDAGGARLGVGKIKELGEIRDNHRMLKVEFGQRGGVYNLEDSELMLSTKTKRASDHRS